MTQRQTEYKVAWEIDLTADTPEDAARKALAIMRNPDSIATVFEVWGNDQVTHVDLTEIDEPDDPLDSVSVRAHEYDEMRYPEWTERSYGE